MSSKRARGVHGKHASARYVAPFPRHAAHLTPEDAVLWRQAHPMAWERLRELARAENGTNIRHVLALLRSTHHCPAGNRQALELARLLADMLSENG